MKDPNRLFEDGSPFEKSLLQSGRAEDPSRALQGRILAALAASPRAEAAELSNPAPRPSLGRFLRPRGIVLAVAAIGLGAVVAGSLGSRREPSPPTTVGATARPALADPAATMAVAEPAAAPRSPEVIVTPDSLPSVAVPSPLARGSAAPSAKPAGAALPTTAPTLEREIELLDGVKSKLGAGSAAQASTALDAYDAEFPNGALRPEGTVLRVRTLLLQGNRAAANKLADEFLAAHPGSVHGKRMRALLAE